MKWDFHSHSYYFYTKTLVLAIQEVFAAVPLVEFKDTLMCTLLWNCVWGAVLKWKSYKASLHSMLVLSFLPFEEHWYTWTQPSKMSKLWAQRKRAASCSASLVGGRPCTMQSVTSWGLLECLQEQSLTRRYREDFRSHHPIVSPASESIEVGTPTAAVITLMAPAFRSQP